MILHGKYIVIILILILLHLIFIQKTFSVSPQFPRQQIIVASNDWQLLNETLSNVITHENILISTYGAKNIAV